MACNCKSEIEAKLNENFKAATPDARDHKVTLKGYGFGIINNTIVMQPFFEYEGFSYVPLKKGGEKPKKVIGNMIFSYCPFCGESLKKESTNG
jgi:hypothetical protein